MAAPTKYKATYNQQAKKLCLLGATDVELADFFEVHVDTIYEWKKVYPSFSEAIKKGKLAADAEIASKLFKRASGYTYDEITFEKVDSQVSLAVTSTGDIKADDSYKKKVVTKEVAPDTTAIIFWLKNRRPQDWKDKQEMKHSGEIVSVNVTAEEAKQIAAALNKEV